MRIKSNAIEYNNINNIITERNKMKMEKLMVKIIREWNCYSHKQNVYIILICILYRC